MDLFGSGMPLIVAALGIGFVIFVHELGHFLFAKWAGVKVHTFSIGFGPAIFRRTVGETDYQLSILPFGGYVAMQEEGSEDRRGLTDQHPWWQAAILFAGVLFNLISSFLLLLCLAWYGSPHHPPVVGEIVNYVRTTGGDLVESPASRLGLLRGDRILSYNDAPIRTFHDLIAAVGTGEPVPIQMRVQRGEQELSLPASGSPPVRAVHDQDRGMPTLGLLPEQSNLLAAVLGSEAIKPGWRLIGVDDVDTTEAMAWQIEDLLAARVGEQISFRFATEAGPVEVSERYGGSLGSHDGAVFGLPVEIAGFVAAGAAPGPAERAGILPGDRPVALNGEAVVSQAAFISGIRQAAAAAAGPVDLTVLRRQAGGWATVQLSLQAEFDARYNRPMIGVQLASVQAGDLAGIQRSSDNPMLAAGLQPDDALLRLQLGDALSAPVRAFYLRGGETTLIPLTEADWRSLQRVIDPSVYAKFLGARPPPPLAASLQAMRIDSIASSGEVLSLDGAHLRADQTDKAASLSMRRQVIDLSQLSPPARQLLAGLESGDWIINIGAVDADGQRCLAVRRGSGLQEPLQVLVTPRPPGVGFAFVHEQVPYPLNSWTEGFGLAARQCLDLIAQTGKIIAKFFKSEEEGGVSASKSLHGPLGIFAHLKASHENAGLAGTLKIVAFLGLNLFLINLLPIPIADGGRLLFLGIEQIIRRPIPVGVVNAVNLLSFMAIVALMLFVLGADVLRVLDRH